MSSRFEKTELKCVVIASSRTVRGTLSAILKELSFTNITPVADIKTCIEIMESEPVDWIITPTSDSEGGHALYIMNIINKMNALRAIKVSVLRDQDDSTIPQLFELGILSAHKTESSRESIMTQFQTLFHRVDYYEGDTIRVAADYLGDFLLEKQEFSELKRFYNSLLQIYPGRSEIVFNLAKTLLRNREDEEGKMLLQQLLLTAPDKKSQIEEACRVFLPGENLESIDSKIAEHFGFKTCLIVDADKNNLDLITDMMSRLGFKELVTFEEPLALMKWVRHNPTPHLVVSEWQLPNIPGPIFLYKLRNRLDLNVPIIIINQQMSERDGTWIKELDVSCLVAKPVVEKDLFQAVLWTLQQSKGPSDVQSLKTKLKILSKRQDPDLPRFRHLYMQHPMLIESDRLLMEAHLAYDAGCYLHAKKYALDAVRGAGDPREALQILSQSLMKMREFDAALRCLENVTSLSPYNVSYLCEIAECHLENGDDKKFETYLDQARDIDPDAEVVIETEAKGAMKRGHTEAAKKLLQKLKSFKEVLAFMNNRAVALIQVGRHDEGLDLYHKVLASLPDGQGEVRSLISYNLGLGYARSQRLEEAASTLEAAMHTKNSTRLKKANSLKTRLQKAIEAGESLVFPVEKPASLEEEESKMQMIRDIKTSSDMTNKITRSDYCLFRIYRSLMDDTKSRSVLDDAPLFTPRGKMVKDYIHGISLVSTNFPDIK